MSELDGVPGSLTVSQRAVLAVVPRLGAGWLRLTRGSMRVRWEGREDALPGDGGPVVYCFWHSQLAMMPWVQLRPPSVVAISRSYDGDITARLFARVAVESVRGSTSRGGGAALRGLLRAVRRGQDLAITPDGPRGPRERAQQGAAWLAQASGRPLLPVAFACRPSVRLRTWDRLVFPLPLSRGVFVYGKRLRVAREGGADALHTATEELDKRLRQATERARSLLVT